MDNTLFLRLEGLMQAWGGQHLGDWRGTQNAPTQSGVVGLLANALGWERERDAGRIDELAGAIRIGVRIDRAGWAYRDLHTITTGVPDARGRAKTGKGRLATGLTYRDYLVGARFLVAAQTESARIDELAAAVQTPARVLVLGRRACLPSVPVYAGTGRYADLLGALRAYPPLESAELGASGACVFAEIVCAPDAPQAERRMDVPIRSAARFFGSRYVQVVQI